MPPIKDQMEQIYRGMSLENIPWNREAPPDILQSLIQSRTIIPCKAIELGCGTGNYVMYLTQQGFEVMGVDISNTAIEIAKKSASEKGVKCKFIAADVLGDMPEIRETYDFAYDWELLHHIFPEDREKYVRNVHRILKPGCRYLSVCFSETSPQFRGKGKYRKTPINTILYFSSENEMKSLFELFFEIEELKTIDIEGKFATHKAIYAFLKKR
jgi:SAM-dependent methyltransferase